MAARTLSELCNVIRTKNAGPYVFTCDVMFKQREIYEQVMRRRLLTPETIAQAYNIPIPNILVFETCDELLAIKASIRRRFPSGSPGDSDCYAMSQDAPLANMLMETEHPDS